MNIINKIKIFIIFVITFLIFCCNSNKNLFAQEIPYSKFYEPFGITHFYDGISCHALYNDSIFSNIENKIDTITNNNQLTKLFYFIDNISPGYFIIFFDSCITKFGKNTAHVKNSDIIQECVWYINKGHNLGLKIDLLYNTQNYKMVFYITKFYGQPNFNEKIWRN